MDEETKADVLRVEQEPPQEDAIVFASLRLDHLGIVDRGLFKAGLLSTLYVSKFPTSDNASIPRVSALSHNRSSCNLAG